MLISFPGASGELRRTPSHGAMRAISCGTWVHRLSVLSIALASSVFASSRAYALNFAEAREIAEQQSPRVSAQRLQIDAVESAQKAAGTLPDPKLSIGMENYPISGMDRWSLTREPMTGQRLALMQEVPNQAKREAKVASAQARVERERAALVLQRLQIRQELGLAWIAAQAVEQRDRLLAELLAENRRLQDSLPARVAGGSAQAGDLLAAQQEALALSDRRDDLQRDRAKARAMLRRWVGSRADEALQGDTDPLVRPVAQLRSDLSRHAELALYPAMQSMARAESHEAQAESRGDWSWEVAYSRRDRRWGDMVSFQVTFDLPELKNALRSGDIWVQGSRQFKDFEDYLVPHAKFSDLRQSSALPLAVTTDCEQYLHERLTLLESQLATVNRMAAANDLPDALITESGLKITPLDAAVPETAQALIDQTAMSLPHVKITELLQEVDEWTGRQQIACTRSFGQPVTELGDLKEAVTEFASRAAHKLRQQNSHVMAVLVFIRTSPFRQSDPQYARSTTIPLRRPTSDTLEIVQTALWGLERIYKAGYCYAKAGVMLLDLQDAGRIQTELDLEGDFHANEHQERRKRLMVAMDAVNDRFGRGALQLGAAGTPRAQHRWGMRQERRSPRYTTHWEELLVVS